MNSFKIWLISAALFITAIISVQNAAPASLSFFLWSSISMPLGILLTLSLCTGLVLSTIIFPVRYRR